MDKKQLLALFAISLAISTVGSSMGALLPVNAVRLGTNPDGIGPYMAGVYIGLASGVLTTGWLSNRLKRRNTGHDRLLGNGTCGKHDPARTAHHPCHLYGRDANWID